MIEKFKINIERNKEFVINALRATNREGIDKLIESLLKSDYFTAPASTVYHMNMEGGLVQHSINVYKILQMKNRAYHMEIPEDTMAITALLHDACKINVYYKGKKSVKTPTGWQEKLVWQFRDENPLGHGEKSVIMLQRYIELTQMEALMIRWHMGVFDEHCDRRAFNNALALCPEIGLLHTSDAEAGWCFEWTEE